MPTSTPSSRNRKRSFVLLWLLLPVLASTALYRLHTFDPAPLPLTALAAPPLKAPLLNARLLSGAEVVGSGRLDGPEEIAYHPESGLIYTGCVDGWVKRVRLNDSVVDDWVNTGGRPLGIAFGPQGEVIVADADKGLLNISKDGSRTELVTEEAEGVRFKLTDGVDVGEDGVIYFTDASYRYSLKEFMMDILEGKPNGRLLSHDPSTKTTTVLLRDLYFANGISLSPDQTHLIFCETPLRRCSKYHIRGEKRGEVEIFVEGLPGLPDNIRHDREGHYWIALATAYTAQWKVLFRHPTLRKVVAIATKYGMELQGAKGAGVFQVDLEGKPIAHYYDPSLSFITSGLKIGNNLFCGSISYPHITRLNLLQFPALPYP
ncbi:PREDICTED: protein STRICTOSIDINE SYNTHASE-LIKE 5-like [Tarenaya hassleriana]|uniref:protein STRICTOSIDINE SYNTHASE-LIKE 5-like n=1 Tax=Tarenaya hassleriana TaxID=28532 RepID=UPI00053CA366|nr:PREDICTED: protein STRICTOSIDINE SYNTHASE-LIKE 5-like [Tarenaya hassleriana]